MNKISINTLISKILKNNTLLINVIEFFGLLVIGVALYGSSVYIIEEIDEVVLMGVLIFLVVLSFPLLTAWALLYEDKKDLQKIIRMLNWCLIIFWIVGSVFVFIFKFPKGWIFFGAIFFALPGWINIRALNRLINSDKNLKSRRRARHKSI